MSRREIERKFDEIVAFAEVEQVPRHAGQAVLVSGMYVRLAFAVAAHLEPEVLLVDEVLAVGDAAFQQKCLGKMGQVSRQGRTVLFVSHNMAAVKTLCTRAVLFEGGRLVADGDVDGVVDRYLTGGLDTARTGIIPENASRYTDLPGRGILPVGSADGLGRPAGDPTLLRSTVPRQFRLRRVEGDPGRPLRDQHQHARTARTSPIRRRWTAARVRNTWPRAGMR